MSVTGSFVDRIRNPETLVSMDLEQWDLFIRQARRANLLSYCSTWLRDQGLLSDIAEPVRRHLVSENNLADQQKRVIEWEIEQIRRALGAVSIPAIFLKGAAYVAADLPPARGRRFSDVDILVPHERLKEAEQALFLHGWFGEKLDPYDQQYYRRWMHEIPPLRHSRRRTVIDVHHTIVPLTMAVSPDPEKLLADTVAVDDTGEVRVLSPVDMVLHSASHLFLDGEFQNALRDLVDLDQLTRRFAGEEEGFWDRLHRRSVELELQRPLYYAVVYLRRVLGTQVPPELVEVLKKSAPAQPISWLMEGLLDRAVCPHHASCSDALSGTARWMLYMRGHYLRMPMYLLIPHLLRKALRRSPEESVEPGELKGDRDG